jgi:uncharacterized protein (DUF1800 family)
MSRHRSGAVAPIAGFSSSSRFSRGLAAVALAATLAACGGGGGGDSGPPPPTLDLPATRAEAARFLTQATFGPVDADIDRVMAVGYTAWINEQFTRPAMSHRANWEAADAAAKVINPAGGVFQDGVINSFWKGAITGEDQLRQRVAYALSQILVISMQDGTVGENPRAVAAYLDMLGDKGLGNYRELLESVSLHPMMGVYLTSLRNQKADPARGRVPDENYAREVMQLFSIGLAQLDAQGRVISTGGVPNENYGPADISGMAKVFTGFSWACPDAPDNACFSSGSANGNTDPDRSFKSMLGYPQYHSKEEKRFLGTTIPAKTAGETADPLGSLRVALDTLYNHPNVGPFIGKQLIQRLVTSNPSPAYVGAVAAAFADNGSGVRGDMKAVVRAVLTHPEARQMSTTSGKVREPVLRLSAYLRAIPHTSDTGDWRVGNTDSITGSLGQTPMRSPSVFNFYRPGYVPPGTQAATAGLVAPELALTQETSVAGYVNFMRDNMSSGVGQFNGTVGGVARNRRDLQPDFTAELALATDVGALLTRLSDKLMYGQMPAALKTEIQTAVEKIVIPTLNSTGSNQAAVDSAKRNRVNAALLLTLVSPEYQTQK